MEENCPKSTGTQQCAASARMPPVVLMGYRICHMFPSSRCCFFISVSFSHCGPPGGGLLYFNTLEEDRPKSAETLQYAESGSKPPAMLTCYRICNMFPSNRCSFSIPCPFRLAGHRGTGSCTLTLWRRTARNRRKHNNRHNPPAGCPPCRLAIGFVICFRLAVAVVNVRVI